MQEEIRSSEGGGREKAELGRDQGHKRSPRGGETERGGGGSRDEGLLHTARTAKLLKRFKGIPSVGWGCAACPRIKERFYLLHQVPGATPARNRNGKKSGGEQQKSWFLNTCSREFTTEACSATYEPPTRTPER